MLHVRMVVNVASWYIVVDAVIGHGQSRSSVSGTGLGMYVKILGFPILPCTCVLWKSQKEMSHHFERPKTTDVGARREGSAE